MKSKTVKNVIRLEYLLYSFLIGLLVGAVIWIFLQIMNGGIALLWQVIPDRIELPFYPVIIGIIGGLLIGLEQKKFGEYPEEMGTVFSTIKKTGDYGKGKLPLLFISALLPLIFGAPLGPEAGAVGLIAALCLLVGKMLSQKKSELMEMTEVSISAGLATLFNAPLFGLVNLNSKDESQNLKHPYANLSAIVGGFTAILLLKNLTGLGSGGIERFSGDGVFTLDTLFYFIPVILIGSLFGILFNWFEPFCLFILRPLRKFPVLKAVLCGIIIGLIFMVEPIILFSGEEQMGELAVTYQNYSALGLVGIALLKLFMINFCVESGWRGGHFFPAIFAGSCLGFGLSLLFPNMDVILCVALSCSALLGALMKKPLLVALLLVLCYPLNYIIFTFAAAVIGSTLSEWLNRIFKVETKKKEPESI